MSQKELALKKGRMSKMNHFYRYPIQPALNYWPSIYHGYLTQRNLSMGQPAYPMQQNTGENHCISQAEVDYRNEMRSLWEEHVAWTRMAIISLVFDLPDIEFVLKRLLKNAEDMGNMIRRLYGDVVGNTYTDLIQQHLLIAADLVKAAIAGDEQAVTAADKEWHDNADEIAVFLNSVNRYLTEEAVRDMFYHHLDLTKQEAVAMINKDFQKDIDAYDEIEKQAREMADAISDAMVMAYPSVF